MTFQANFYTIKDREKLFCSFFSSLMNQSVKDRNDRKELYLKLSPKRLP